MSNAIDALFVRGSLVVGGPFVPPTGSITDNSIIAAAGVRASKLQQQYVKEKTLSAHAAAASATRQQIHRVMGATATILSFGVVASQAAGAASSATIDLKKNGVSILTATITLDNGTAAFALKAGTLSSASAVAGDVFEAEVTAVAGANVPKGLTAYLWFNEDPA